MCLSVLSVVEKREEKNTDDWASRLTASLLKNKLGSKKHLAESVSSWPDWQTVAVQRRNGRRGLRREREREKFEKDGQIELF